MSSETVIENLENIKGDKPQLIETLKSAVKCAFVKEFEQGDERPCENRDFIEQKDYFESCILKIKKAIDDLESNSFLNGSFTSNEIDNELLALLIIMCGENAYTKPWTTEISIQSCSAIVTKILNLFECRNISDLMLKRNFVKPLFQILCKSLTKTTWKHFPSLVVCFVWILEKIKQPELSSHLLLVLPTSLLLVDDFVTENKVLGVRCLDHIINNVTIAELQFHGHGDVIYSALLPQLRLREAELLSLTIPCLLKLTSKLEIDFGRKNLTKWSRFDDVSEIILENMELEQMIDIRNCYTNNLEFLITSSDLHIVRWSKRLLRIFRDYIQIAEKYNDSKTTHTFLKIINKYIEITKPLAPYYRENLLFTLFITSYKTLNTSEEQSEVTNIIIKNIKLMLEAVPENKRKQITVEFQKKFKENKKFEHVYSEIMNFLNS